MNSEKEYPNLNTPNAIKNRFSGERAVELGKKGNKKRSENIQLKKLLIKALQGKAESDIAKEIMKQSGVEASQRRSVKNKEVLAQSIILQALGGNFKMTQLLIKMIGELPNDNTAFNIENQKHDLDTIVNALKGVNDDEQEDDN